MGDRQDSVKDMEYIESWHSTCARLRKAHSPAVCVGNLESSPDREPNSLAASSEGEPSSFRRRLSSRLHRLEHKVSGEMVVWDESLSGSQDPCWVFSWHRRLCRKPFSKVLDGSWFTVSATQQGEVSGGITAQYWKNTRMTVTVNGRIQASMKTATLASVRSEPIGQSRSCDKRCHPTSLLISLITGYTVHICSC